MSLIDPTSGQVRPLLKDYEGTFWLCEWAPDFKHLIAEAAVGTRARLLRIDIEAGKATALADVLNSGPPLVRVLTGAS